MKLINILLVAISVLCVSCQPAKKDEHVHEELKTWNTLADKGGGVLSMEWEEETEFVYFGYTLNGETVFNGSLGSDRPALYHSHGYDDSGNEIVLVDVGIDGVADSWALIAPDGRLIERREIVPLSSPF